MTNTDTRLIDGDRVSHQVKGLGTVKKDPEGEDLVVDSRAAPRPDSETVYVVWDDHRFPVGKVPVAELEKLNPATAAVSTGH